MQFPGGRRLPLRHGCKGDQHNGKILAVAKRGGGQCSDGSGVVFFHGLFQHFQIPVSDACKFPDFLVIGIVMSGIFLIVENNLMEGLVDGQVIRLGQNIGNKYVADCEAFFMKQIV